jgi:hypothetical protein
MEVTALIPMAEIDRRLAGINHFCGARRVNYEHGESL